MESDILKGLNDQQRCAVTSVSNVLQVLAPPGSGKTKTLTARVAYHIAYEGLKPWNMIVCTFTIKAAREMKERIKGFVGEEMERKLVLGTFHSVARRYLSTYGQYIGLPKLFGIADTNDSRAIVKRIIKNNNYAMDANVARSRISKRKSRKSKPRSTKAPLNVEQQEFEAIFSAYEEELRLEKLLDYDDLLLKCVELLNKHPECVSNVQAVLIDEFQDTNHVQYDLMNLFAQHRNLRPHHKVPKITIVGDPDQSIYSFRSAEIENLNRMRQKYADHHVVHLAQNYRSSAYILTAAKAVIEQDTARLKKPLEATHAAGQSPVLRILSSAANEAAWLVSEIQRTHHLNAGLLRYSDYAVLLRSAALSRHIETELGRAGIPYRMVGGHKFFDRVEVRILLDYLRAINQPDHNDAVLRVLNMPSRKIGDGTINELMAESQSKQRSLWSVIEAVAQGRYESSLKISNQAMEGLESFTGIIISSRNKLGHPNTSIGQLLAHVMQRTSYETFLKNKYKEDYQDRASSVDELVELAKSGRVFAEQEEELIQLDGVNQQPSQQNDPVEILARFLANIALATDADKQEAQNGGDQVVISTIHAAKGLEWPVVFIPAMYQGSIPHSRAEDNDEERRLLYVGMTRAKALLYLSYPKKSSISECTILSPFVSPQEMLPFFQPRGPTVGYKAVESIAKVLNRECPVETAIIDKFAALESRMPQIRPEDDYYPEDGEELNELHSDCRSVNTGTNLPTAFSQSAKRRRVEVRGVAESSLIETTMSKGFTSAKVCMEELQYESTSSRPPSSTSTSKFRTANKAADLGKKKAKAGQLSIDSFFGRPRITEPKMAEEAHVPHIPQDSRSTLSTPAALLRASSNTLCSIDPPVLDERRPGNKISRPPQRQIIDDDEQTSRYVLLSSSPPRPPSQDGHEGTADKLIGKEIISVANTIEAGSRQTYFYQTSMQKIANGRRLNYNSQRPLPQQPFRNGFVNKPFVPPTMRHNQ